MPATLEKLVAVRSRLVEQDLLPYLDGMVKRAAELPQYFPKNLRNNPTSFMTIRQRVQVIEDRSALEQWRAEELERSHAAGVSIETLAYSPHRGRPENDGEPKTGPPPPKPIYWDERTEKRFSVILGDPGFGKSWLLRYEACRLASAGAQGLRDGTVVPEQLILPIWLRLFDLTGSDDALEEALVRIISRGYSKAFGDFVRQTLTTERSVLLLDAWDEIPAGHRQQLGQRLEAFANDHRYQARILITSRIVGYTRLLIPEAQELELLAFDPPQIEEFVGVWFGQDQANTFRSMLRDNHPLRGLARIPLMLTFLCRQVRENTPLPTRRSELYERCLWGLLKNWKEEKEQRKISDKEVGGILKRLADGALKLQSRGLEQFTEAELAQALGFDLASQGEAEAAVKFIQSRQADGILIPVCTTDRLGESRWIFLHRTFQEYLAALALAHQDNWLQVALAHVYDPAWSEVIKLLAGTVGDRARIYLQALLQKNAEDLLCRPLLLALAALTEVPQSLADHWIKPLMDIGVQLYHRNSLLVERKKWVHFFSRWPESALPHLVPLLQDPNPDVLLAAVDALGKIGSEVLPHILPFLQDPKRYVRLAAVDVLGNIGSEVLPHLLPLLQDPDPTVRRAVVGLRKIGFSVDDFLLLAQEQDFDVHSAVADALGKIGSTEARHTLRQLLQDPFVCWEAADALQRIAWQNKILIPLTQVPKDMQKEMRWLTKELADLVDQVKRKHAGPA